MGSSYRVELDKWLQSLDVKANSVLDIGGSQLPIKGRTKSWQVKEYKIADLEDPHVGSPKPDMVLDLNYENDIFEAFDLIFCLEVFDYIWNPALAFETIEELLEPGGTAWVTFPFMYPTHQPIEDDALRYTEGGIRKLAAHASLTVDQLIRRRPETSAVEMMWRSERMRAAKHYDHNVTGWIVALRKAA
jgi:SAM-dependent methyltransferase